MKDRLLSGERLDDLQRDGLMIIQNPKWFCFGMDAVLLSSFANVPEGKKSTGSRMWQWHHSNPFIR